jgi:peroxiredoxin
VFSPDKYNNDIEQMSGVLLDSYRGLGQHEDELVLALLRHARRPAIGHFMREVAAAHDTLGGADSAAKWLDKADPARTLVGQRAAEFTLPASGGGQVSLKELLKGRKAVLINFWFYNCGPCRAEAPHLQRLYADLKGRGLEIIAIDRGDGEENVAKFVKQFGLTFPLALGGKGQANDVFSLYGVQVYPTNFLIDGDGKIVWYSPGYDEDQLSELRQRLAKLGVE